MHYSRPVLLSIAGYDPSGGAGVLADVKTWEQHKCLGMAVLTADTIQTEDRFIQAGWKPLDAIIAQAAPLMEQYRISVVKIGIVESLDVLSELVSWLKLRNKDLKIIWDPVLSASAGPSLFKAPDRSILKEVLTGLFLITPNIEEASILGNDNDEHHAAEWLSAHVSVLLKGGHSLKHPGKDILYTNGKITELPAGKENLPAKHGSGCILSSAIAARLAAGHDLETACRYAKTYIETILNSNKQLLAYHHV